MSESRRIEPLPRILVLTIIGCRINKEDANETVEAHTKKKGVNMLTKVVPIIKFEICVKHVEMNCR